MYIYVVLNPHILKIDLFSSGLEMNSEQKKALCAMKRSNPKLEKNVNGKGLLPEAFDRVNKVKLMDILSEINLDNEIKKLL